MSNELIGLLGIIVLFILLACRLWIGSAMALVGFLGILVMRNGVQAMAVLASQPFGTQNNYVMTVVPMFIGYFVAAKLLKLELLNNMGSITGGMTSTPALGTLITSCGTDDVAAAYAATYPIALVSIILVCQFLVLLG